MTRILSLIALAACGGSAPALSSAPAEPLAVAAAEAAWESYGATPTRTESLPSSTLFAAKDTYVGQTVLVEGQVADVCQKAGCWMVMTNGEESMRVRMKDHAFALPKDCTGATARIEGEVVALPLDPADVEHFAGESAKPDAMPEKALPPEATHTYELVATAVQLKR